MTKIIAAFCFAMTATLACAVHAQTATADVTDMNALREAVKTDKRAFVASTLALTDAQAKRFWPIYDQYQRGMEAANRIRAVALQGLLSREGPVTDLYAKQLAGDLIASDEAPHDVWQSDACDSRDEGRALHAARVESARGPELRSGRGVPADQIVMTGGGRQPCSPRFARIWRSCAEITFGARVATTSTDSM